MIAIDMPMPKNCAECPLRWTTDENNLCIPFSKEGARVLKEHDPTRPDWCPLIDLNDKKEGATHEQ